MKIAMVSEHASPLACLGGIDAGGQNVHVAALSAALARRGHQVVVYTRRDDPSLPVSVPLLPGVRVEHLSAGPAAVIGKDALLPYMEGFGAQLAKRLRVQQPQIVHAHFWMSGLAALQATAELALPVVQTFHALGKVKRRWQGESDTSPAERIGAERLVARAADLVIATCTDEVRELLSMGVPRRQVTVVPCGVDLSLFTPPARPVQPDGPLRILILGRLVPRKGIADAIVALARVPGAELVVVGGPDPAQLAADDEFRRLSALAVSSGVPDRVRLLGRLPHAELPEVMRSCQLLLAVPWYEPFGIAPLEAMAAGLPVVATAVGGLQDTVVDGVTGLLVPPRRPDLLAQAVNELLSDPSRRLAMGRAGRERVVARYGWDSVAEQTEACYSGVLAGRRAVELDRTGAAPAGPELTDVTAEVAR
jgi:D-inositol-3-phosphate glycosyltransferase